MKKLKSYKLFPATLRMIEEMSVEFDGNATAVVEASVTERHARFQERSAMTTRMSYEAELEEIDEVVLERARQVHGEVCGCDSKHCDVTNQIYHWLMEGDRGEGRSSADLAAEWTEWTAEDGE